MYLSRHGKINFVDLAGSEMTKKTNSQGKTLEEANNINKSLMVLGMKMYKVTWMLKVNFIDSRLLHIAIERSEKAQRAHPLPRFKTYATVV